MCISAHSILPPILIACAAARLRHSGNHGNKTIAGNMQGFGLQYVDVNGDGRRDLLVSNNQPDGTGSVIVLEVPKDIRSQAFPMHTLITGFKPTGFGPGKGGPGAVQAFRPKDNGVGPMNILVGGDDNGTVVMLSPDGPAASWRFNATRLLSFKGTVGGVIATDLDGDQWTEIVVPDYSGNTLGVYTFAPVPSHQV